MHAFTHVVFRFGFHLAGDVSRRPSDLTPLLMMLDHLFSSRYLALTLLPFEGHLAAAMLDPTVTDHLLFITGQTIFQRFSETVNKTTTVVRLLTSFRLFKSDESQ